MVVEDRGRIPVCESSWMMGWYSEWRRNKGWDKTARAQIDLCHFMRVLMIFGPWRWFWQSPLLFGIPPFAYVLLLCLLGAIALSFVLWTAASLWALVVTGVVLGLAGVMILVGYGIHTWVIHDKKRAERVGEAILEGLGRFVYYVFMPIWWPIYKLVQGAKWFGRTSLGPAFKWFFDRRLFSLSIGGELVSFTGFGLLSGAAVIFTIASNTYFHPVIVGIVFGSLVVGGLLITSVVVGAKSLDRRAAARAAEHAENEVEEKPKKQHETRALVWAWLVSKKHRICPLIEVKSS